MATSSSHPEHCGSGDFDLDLDKTPTRLKEDTELNSFLGRVDEITAVISALASTDPAENERGIRQADILLHEKNVGGCDLACQVTQDRSVINKVKEENRGQSQDELSTQAFMRSVEEDVERRTADRKERKVESDKFRKKGNILFGQKDFAGALKNYNEAIKLIRDSPCLYNNRALTYLRLGLYSSAVEECDKALRLEEHSLRGRMFLAKALFLLGNADKCRETLNEARAKLPGNLKLIDTYERDLFNMNVEKPFDFDLDTEKKWQAAERYEGTEFPVKQKPKITKNRTIVVGGEKSGAENCEEIGTKLEKEDVPDGAGGDEVEKITTVEI